MRNERVPMPTRCIDCSTVSAIARMPVPRAATDGMRQSCCKRSVKLRACLSKYRSNFAKLNLCFPCLIIHFKQNVSRLFLAPLESRANKFLRKRFFKLIPHTRLLITRSLGITLNQSTPVCWYRDRCNSLPFKRRLSTLPKRVHASRIYIPRRIQPIARQPRSLIVPVINAIKVVKIRINSRAKPVEIEVRISRHHRIPRPLDKLPAFPQSALTLRPLQT